jgi:hypothetical protein
MECFASPIKQAKKVSSSFLKGFSKEMIPFHGSCFKYTIVPC